MPLQSPIFMAEGLDVRYTENQLETISRLWQITGENIYTSGQEQS